MFPNESSGSCSTMAQCYCGCRSVLCECVPLPQNRSHTGAISSSVYSAKMTFFFLLLFQWLLDGFPPLFTVFCLGVTVQWGPSRVGYSKMQQKQQKKVKERWEDWCVCMRTIPNLPCFSAFGQLAGVQRWCNRPLCRLCVIREDECCGSALHTCMHVITAKAHMEAKDHCSHHVQQIQF